MRRIAFLAGLSILIAAGMQSRCAAQAIFSNSSDTIQVQGNPALSGEGTYEAVVQLSSISIFNPYGLWSGGTIYNSYQSGQEDNHFGVSESGAAEAIAFPLDYNYFGASFEGGSLSTGVWYDLAFEYDGTQESMYVDGTLVSSRPVTGPIGSWPFADTVIGAIDRDGGMLPSFLGEIESLRISNTALYTGASYAATVGDFTDQSSTLLLYDFNDVSAGSTSVPDLSGNGYTGLLGVGFDGATSPTFVTPLPASASAAALGLAMTALFTARRRQSRC